MSEQLNQSPAPDEEETTQQAVVEESAEEQAACPSIFDKPDPDRYKAKVKKPRKNGRHTTNVMIALALCVAIVLGGEGLFWAVFHQEMFSYGYRYFTKDKSEEESSQPFEEPVDNIFDYSAYKDQDANTDTLALGGISSVLVENQTGAYTLTSKSVSRTEYDEQTGQETTTQGLDWLITDVKGEDIKGVTFDPSTVSFIVTDLLKIPYTDIYAQDGTAQIPQGGITYYQECGLEKAKTKCTVNFKNGASVKVMVGDKTPTGDNYFVGIENNDGNHPEALGAPKTDRKIYQVSSAAIAFFIKEAKYYVHHEIISMVEQAESTYNDQGEEVEDPYFIQGALSYFDDLTVSGSAYPKALSFKNVEQDRPGYDSIYLMTAPIVQNVKLEAMETLLAPVAEGLRAANCLSMRATAAQLSQYGLNKPTCAVRYVVKNKEYQLQIGKKTNEEENCYAVMVKGNPSIFEVKAENLAFKDYDTADYASNTIYACDITKVKTLRVQQKGVDETFRLTHGTDDQGAATLKVTTASGKTIDEEKFRTMYMNLLSLSSFTNVTDGKDAPTPYVTITLTYNDYSQVDVIRLSNYTDRRYYMSLNGMGSTVVLSNNVDTLVDSVNALLK
ncbi:MAG: DUF4340 domain-containing protein [Clostridia bacterium]|nr:DUF4340 domain-containing protein [Clostridia bacterium]